MTMDALITLPDINTDKGTKDAAATDANAATTMGTISNNLNTTNLPTMTKYTSFITIRMLLIWFLPMQLWIHMLIDAAAAMAANSHTVIGNKDAAHATDYSTIMTGTKVDAECVPSFTIDAADALDLSHHNDTYLSNDDSNVNCHHQEVNTTHSVDS
jgi:hypothetical protein